MQNPLSQIIGGQKLDTETLPYTGEKFSPGNTSNVQMAGGSSSPAEVDLYAKYKDPKTGNIMSPEEYATYLGNKAPAQGGDIGTYSGDAVSDPGKSTNELTSEATRLNNARNNIAVGETDPYKVANKSGIDYSPEQLTAIQNAYAGVYDPALEDVFTRLREKKVEDDRLAERDLIKFKTDEAIRQSNATKKSSNPDPEDGDLARDYFSAQNIAKASANANAIGIDMDIEAMGAQGKDYANFWYYPPKNRDGDDFIEVINDNYKGILDGVKDKQEFIDEINSQATIPRTIRDQIMAKASTIKVEEEEGTGWWKKLFPGY